MNDKYLFTLYAVEIELKIYSSVTLSSRGSLAKRGILGSNPKSGIDF